MLTFRKLFPIILIGLVLAYLVPQLAAQEPNRAALVVRLEDGSVQTSCVEFPEAQITGYELLQRSGLDVTVDVQGMGALVCNIEGSGCPANDCLCQCRGGGECQYWSYWHQLDGEWLYSRAGAMAYPVLDGAVEGWSWGPGAVADAVTPPDTTFASVCQAAPGQTSGTAVLAADKGVGEDTAVAWLPYLLFTFILFIPAWLIWRANRRANLS